MIPIALRAETFKADFQGSPQYHSHSSSNIHWAPTQQGLAFEIREPGEIRLITQCII